MYIKRVGNILLPSLSQNVVSFFFFFFFKRVHIIFALPLVRLLKNLFLHPIPAWRPADNATRHLLMSHKITAFSPLFAYHFILCLLLTHQFCSRQPYLQIQLPKLFQIHFTGPLAMSHSSVESMTDYNGGSSMEQAVWEHAFWHHFNINGTYPALLRVIVVCFFKSM